MMSLLKEILFPNLIVVVDNAIIVVVIKVIVILLNYIPHTRKSFIRSSCCCYSFSSDISIAVIIVVGIQHYTLPI